MFDHSPSGMGHKGPYHGYVALVIRKAVSGKPTTRQYLNRLEKACSEGGPGATPRERGEDRGVGSREVGIEPSTTSVSQTKGQAGRLRGLVDAERRPSRSIHRKRGLSRHGDGFNYKKILCQEIPDLGIPHLASRLGTAASFVCLESSRRREEP